MLEIDFEEDNEDLNMDHYGTDNDDADDDGDDDGEAESPLISLDVQDERWVNVNAPTW